MYLLYRMFFQIKKRIQFILLSAAGILSPSTGLYAQQSYFIDGFHGGIWGHFPYQYTSFIAGQMDKNPQWKLNFEIEPVTWDSIQNIDPKGYNQLKQWLNTSSPQARIEYVNPDYGQSYLFNISGESIIRQFKYGMAELRKHFPQIAFTTYSSEEPCFTSALPAILTSYGIKYASLKNPNTCWGGYTAAHGGELVNWIGPDGSSILTVPRYATEKLASHSTWQTDAWNNSNDYIQDARDHGIENPVGMCLQDAGWRNGPWFGTKNNVTYTTWRNYFSSIADKKDITDWRVSQEDIKVSLVWGGQILQRVAQTVRKTENTLVNTEAISALNAIYFGKHWSQPTFDIAWKNLLLSQHHDCWIVPYNRKYGKNWQQYVTQWTNTSLAICDSLLHGSKPSAIGSQYMLRIYNASGHDRTETISFILPDTYYDKNICLYDNNWKVIPLQQHDRTFYFMADVPSAGYYTYRIGQNKPVKATGKNIIEQQKDSTYKIETDLYKIVIDPHKGGAIKSLLMKNSQSHELVASGKYLNELRGYFYREDKFRSSTETPASVKMLVNGPLFASLEIKGKIADNPFTQIIKIYKESPIIKNELHIDWQRNTGIGKFDEAHTFKNEHPVKAFYNDKYKLLALFPANLSNVTIYRDAPFDIFKSNLQNTIFNSWDSIKNNVILHWTDAEDKDGKYGLAILSDETTSYVHDADLPLALTLQYSGKGLFGADYTLDGPTDISYAILPHAGNWKRGKVNEESEYYNRPLVCDIFKAASGEAAALSKSFIHFDNNGWVLSSMCIDKSDIIVRLFNAQGDHRSHRVTLDIRARAVAEIKLDGTIEQHLPLDKDGKSFSLNIPPMGFRTIRISGIL